MNSCSWTGEAPVQGHEHRPEPGAGIKQNERVGVVYGEHRDAVAATDPKLALQRPRCSLDPLRQRRIGQRAALEAHGRLVRRERRVAEDEIGEVHGSARAHASVSPGS